MKCVPLVGTDGQCCRINIGKYDLTTKISQLPNNGEANAACTTRDNDPEPFIAYYSPSLITFIHKLYG